MEGCYGQVFHVYDPTTWFRFHWTGFCALKTFAMFKKSSNYVERALMRAINGIESYSRFGHAVILVLKKK